jgi:pSer/pThr/pTyr-binding forkhead associated (FHA) protein
LRFKNMTVGRQNGELARLRVIGGPDNGVVFVITAPKVTLGRGEENEIILTDIKASRKHAEIGIGGGAAVLKDLGSSHGVMINGVPQKQLTLKSGDKIGLGETVMEFIAAESGSTQMIQMPPRITAAVGTGSSGLTQFIPRPQGAPPPSAALGTMPGAPGAAKPKTFFEKNKTLVIGVGLLVGVAMMLPEVEKKQLKKGPKYIDPKEIEGERAVSSLQLPPADSAIAKNADAWFKEGFREFREHNYLRAQAAFETALQVYPDHALARSYLESTKKAMAQEAKDHMAIAKRDEEANRLEDAKAHYDAVKRLFLKDQSNPIYKEADTKMTELDKKEKELEK